MSIYLILLLTILVLNNARKNRRMSDKLFCIIICALFILITGLRHNMVGSDTTVYYLQFQEIKQLSLANVIALGRRDFGFYIFEWFIAKCFHDFVVLTLSVACVFYIPITLLIYRYSEDKGLSYLILMAFMFFQFSMTGVRQTMALGFAIMCMLELLKEKKNIVRVVIWFWLGTIVHRSCLIILPFLLIYLFRRSRIIAKSCLVILPIAFLFRGQLTVMASSIFENLGFELEQYGGGSGGLTTFLVYLLLFVLGMFFTYIGEADYELQPLWLSMMGVTTVLQVFVLVNSVFFRVVWYYSIFLIIYIPKMICASRVEGRSYALINYAILFGLLYMYLGITIGSANVLPYQFFWQGL